MSTVDYSKKKNAELEELLRARGLPHTGKKAELVARLQQHDKEQASASAKSSATTGTVVEDEIDWEDDPNSTSKPSEPAAAAMAAGGIGRVSNPAAVPNQIVDNTDPSSTTDLKVESAPPETTTEPAATTTVAETEAPKDAKSPPAKDSVPVAPLNLPPSSLEIEIAKRKARAARFGLAEPTADESLKALERAKRFGTAAAADGGNTVVKGLDSALPERRKRGRGRDDGENGDEEGREREKSRGKRVDSRRGRDRKPGKVGIQEKEGGQAAKKEGVQGDKKEGAGGAKREGKPAATPAGKASGGGDKSGPSEKDRLAAEARKKRFATAAAPS